MSRRYSSFKPPNPPPEYIDPANDRAFDFVEFDKLYLAPPTTADDIKVDKAKSRLSITADRSITPDDHFVGVNTSGGAVTLTLPAQLDVAEGKIYIIKDEGGSAATNNITINTADSAKIDSLNAVSLVSNYGAISIYCNGSQWHIY